ncbi:DMT family transporter [Bacillus salipaludis]|uniref:DMT family transporter n=1 Tax=Bacillus salipaludis TaxID=2547811 RepID=A0A4R5VNP6_9BACI|nr:DMT family transporter [Bacillus salipaludis]MDQ6595754.1 DMT family transporter [Bacillus salipaludis]TDK59907.1 DMT family transporter [Bacillus salipaludis]
MNQQKSYSRFFTNKYWVVVVAVFCSVLWGSAFPVLKLSYDELGMAEDDLSAKIVFAGIRFMMSSLLLLFFMLCVDRKALKVNWRQWPAIIGLGLFTTSLSYFFFYNGLAHTSGMKASILNSSGVFFVVFLAHFVYKDDRLDWRKVFGLITGFGGIVLSNWGQDASLDFSFYGEGFMLLSGLASTFGTFLSKRLSANLHPFALTGWQMFTGSLIMLVVGVPNLRPHAFEFTANAWLLLGYAVFLSAAAFALWTSLLKYNKAGEVSLYKFVVPVSGTILSVMFLPGEHITVNTIVALLLVAVGLAAVNQKGKKGLFGLRKWRRTEEQLYK